MKGYQVYHTVHPQNTARGGTAVLVKDNMVHHIHEEAKYVTNEIQATAVTIEMKRQAITFAAAYCPPRYNLRKTDYLNFLRSLGKKIYGRR
jgi:exonuclease III